jgi:hypothetical protein
MGEIKVDGFQNIYQSRKIEEPKLPKTELWTAFWPKNGIYSVRNENMSDWKWKNLNFSSLFAEW